MKRDFRPGGLTLDELQEMRAGLSKAWGTAEVDGDSFPIFLGTTLDEHVNAWRMAEAEVRTNYWLLGAIAVRLERAVGGRPESQDAHVETYTRRADTQIQQFIKKVGTNRQTFQRVNYTYRVFAGTRTTGGTRFMHHLSFTHHEVAARLTDSAEEAVSAVALAYDRGWSANMLEQVLTAYRPKKDQQPLRPAFLDKFFRRLERTILAWPLETRERVPYLLWRLYKSVKKTLPPKDVVPAASASEMVVAASGPLHDMEEF